MSEKKIDYINYYKNSIEKNQHDPERVLHCLKKLDTLRINVQHLQETGIGRTVNAVRGLDGEAGELAKNLVNKWKSLVANESEPMSSSNNNSEKEEVPENVKESNKKSHHSSKSSSSSKEKENSKKSKHHHHSSSSSSHHHSHHSSQSKEHKEKRSSDSKSSESSKHKHSGSSHTLSSTSSHHKTITSSPPSSSSCSPSKKRAHEEASSDAKENETRAKRLKMETEKSGSCESKKSSDKESKEHGSNKSSKSKEHKHSSKRKSSKDEDKRQEFDGSTGDIGFAEALMMFDMPSSSKSNKKQLADKMVTVKSSSSSGSVGKSSSSKSTSSSSSLTSKELKHKTALNTRPSTSTAAEIPTQKSLQTLTQPPMLLTQKPKLDLMPDIVSDIPNDVSIPDYRPLPLNTAIKDYIDSNFGSYEGGSRHNMRRVDEAVQFSESFSSKANRTKVFSGNSKTRTEIPKLFDMCIRILQENIDFLECTGGVPFEILKPVLDRAKPEQLSAIEYYNPYLMEESDILWKPHCQRKWKSKQPQEMETWREMYERCTKEETEKLSRLTQNIKHHQEITSNGIQRTKMAYVDSLVKPPRNVMRKQEQFGTNRKLVASPAARVESLRQNMPNIVSGQRGDVRLRVAAGLRDDAQQVVGRGIQRGGIVAKKAPMMAKILQKFKR